MPDDITTRLIDDNDTFLKAFGLRRMPKIERDRIMERAAELAADDYKPGGSLNIGDAFLSDDSKEGSLS